MRARLNGWQRLWVFLSVPFVLIGAGLFLYGLKGLDPENMKAGLAVAAMPPFVMYAVGWGVGWVVRGFRDK